MNTSARRIVITGFMAAGKTTLAEALAARLGARMIDLDYIIRERERRSVPALITEEGEARFREAETNALRVVLEMGAARIIALGGGAWMLEQNRELLAAHNCLTVWLDAPFELCWRRIKTSEAERPLAKSLDLAERLYRERRPVYALAEMHIEAADKSAEELAAEIERAL